jgi:hypothetical protein
MTQPSLFDNPEVGRARHSDPPTAKAAARTISVERLEKRIVELLREYPTGFTTHELSEELGIPLVSISPRMAPLKRKTLVQDSGDTRRTGTGRASIVWKAV